MITTNVDEFKKAAVTVAVEELQDGMVVGLGTGSTAAFALDAISTRVQNGLRIVGIPTSEQTAKRARELGIALSTFEEHDQIDLTIDGADEVEIGTLNLIKGRGGALLREKIVASVTKRVLIVVDETKLVERLGTRSAVPVEVVPFGWQAVARRISVVGGIPALRQEPDTKPFITDSGNYILDCRFPAIASPMELQTRLDSLVGVVEHGLFLGLASEVIIGGPEGARRLHGPR